jgi:cadmium resistance protein CadD (predicted permease)
VSSPFALAYSPVFDNPSRWEPENRTSLLIDALSVLGLIAGSFVATNIDNLAMLVGWLLSGRGKPGQILLGYLLGMSGLLILACGFGLGATFVPDRFIGYLGIIPIALGVKGIYELFRARGETSNETRPSGRRALVLAIAITQLANGVDTVLVLGPLLADSELGVDLAMIGGFVLMVFAWFRLARFLETHASRIEAIERYGHWISPIVLLVIGFYILDNSATDVVPGD